MQDSNTRRPEKPAPDADATSKETMADLAENEKDAGSESSGPGSPDAPGEAQIPSPDGSGDQSRKPDDAGPM